VTEAATNPVAGTPIIRDADELIEALAERKKAMGLSNSLIEELGGFADGYLAKLLGPGRVKRASLATIDRLTEIFGVSFVLVDDQDKVALMAARWKQQRQADASGGQVIRRALPPSASVENGRKGGKKRWENSTPEERRAAARKAAAARWDQRRMTSGGDAARG
jgi:hypothetical protein